MADIITENGKDGNLSLNPDGDITSSGTCERKVSVPFVGHGVGGTKSTTYLHDNVVGEKCGLNDEIYLDIVVPDDWDSGDMTLEVDIETTATEASKESRWQLKYYSYNHGEVTSGTDATLDSGDISMEDNTPYYVVKEDFTISASDFTGKSYISAQLKRIAIVAGAEATTPGVIHIELEYDAKQVCM